LAEIYPRLDSSGSYWEPFFRGLVGEELSGGSSELGFFEGALNFPSNFLGVNIGCSRHSEKGSPSFSQKPG